MTFSSRFRNKLLYAFTDLVALFGALFLTLTIRYFEFPSRELYVRHALPFSIVFIVWLIIMYAQRLYDLSLMRDKIGLYSNLFRASIINILIAIGFFYLLPSLHMPFDTIRPRANLIGTAVIGMSLLGIVRLGLAGQARRAWSTMSVGFWSLTNDELRYMKHFFAVWPKTRITVLDNAKALARLGSLNLIIAGSGKPPTIANQTNPFLVVNRGKIKHIAAFLEDWNRAIPLAVIPYQDFANKDITQTNALYEVVKRIIDLVVASVLLVILAPIAPFIMLAIKLEDRGPVLFTQTRIGLRGQPFKIFKFRSMHNDSDQRQGGLWTEKQDPRITRVGRFLRITHLDEYPQLFNIIRGDMSLVGPRPERPEIVAILVSQSPFYQLRHLAKPGLTGWAQVHYQYADSIETSMRKLEFDLYYLKHRSLLFDAAIILKTLGIFLGGGGR
ncbi:MAG: sugar transferase [Parcubacteria group bacterium GW2011_GWA2_47_8]|nr:MAG: sugar transferase [Parcubacteria group bacterium GW2011_GWA2_47_8]